MFQFYEDFLCVCVCALIEIFTGRRKPAKRCQSLHVNFFLSLNWFTLSPCVPHLKHYFSVNMVFDTH